MGKRDSGWKRFRRWLTRKVVGESPEPAPPAPLPPKDSAYQPQGRLYSSLDRRGQPLLAGRHGAKRLEVYDYCGVVFPKADKVYHYLNTDPALRVGDYVLVPVHVHGVTKEATGIVVSVGQYLSACVPYPLNQTSRIICRLAELPGNE